MDSATDHNVFKLSSCNEMSDLALGDADPRGKLLRGFEAVVFSPHGRAHDQPRTIRVVTSSSKRMARLLLYLHQSFYGGGGFPVC